MAWGRKARRIAELAESLAISRDLRARYEQKLDGATFERDAARIERDAARRKVDVLEKAKKAANDEAAARRVALRESEARVCELEWAVQLLNVALTRTGDNLGSPLTGVNPSELETAREAVRERDIVVKWDDLTGKPEVHFPKKDERRAPWARATGGLIVGTLYPNTSDLLFAPATPFTGNPA